MFYIKFGLKNRADDLPRPSGEVRFVGVPEGFIGSAHYFQIYENGSPLKGLSFQDEKDARQKLRSLTEELNEASHGWYRVESRTHRSLPVRNILAVRKVYGEGSAVNVTYVIRKIVMTQNTFSH